MTESHSRTRTVVIIRVLCSFDLFFWPPWLLLMVVSQFNALAKSSNDSDDKKGDVTEDILV